MSLALLAFASVAWLLALPLRDLQHALMTMRDEADYQLVGIAFVGTIVWLLGGVYSFANIIWPDELQLDQLTAQSTLERKSITSRMLQSVGGLVVAGAAFIGYGLGPATPTSIYLQQSALFVGLALWASAAVIMPAVWVVGRRALTISVLAAHVARSGDGRISKLIYVRYVRALSRSSNLLDAIAARQVLRNISERDRGLSVARREIGIIRRRYCV